MRGWYVDITTIYESIRRNLALVTLWGGGGRKHGELQKALQNVAKWKLAETNGASDAASRRCKLILSSCPLMGKTRG